MRKIKIALISLTANGGVLSEMIADHLGNTHDCTRYCYEKYPFQGAIPYQNLRQLTKHIFRRYDALVFFCACGIVMRTAAPYAESKFTDPAVIAVDEQGKFAVSLLSGHIGGGNALTGQIAAVINAIPVITTATDAGGRFSPDSFAVANGLHIVEPQTAKAAAAAVVNGEKLGLVCEVPYTNLPDEYFTDSGASVGLCISDNADQMPFDITLHLIPKTVIIGIGCKKDTSSEALETFLLHCLDTHQISMEQIAELHTIDMKQHEAAILSFCRTYHIPLQVYSAAELMTAQGEFSHSDFVMQTTGTDNVCERAAVMGGHRLTIAKIAEHGITFAAATRDISIDFERGMA